MNDFDNHDDADFSARRKPVGEPIEAEVVEYLSPAPAFCQDCGTPLEGAFSCRVCAERQQRKAANARARPRETSSITSAVVLYFVLLSSFAILFLDPGNVNLEIAVGILDALIVLIWVVVHRKQVVPLMKLPSNPLWLIAGLATGIVTFLVTHFFLEVVSAAFNVPIIRMTDEYFAAGYTVVIPLLMIVLQPAIVEEFAFRGVIFNVLNDHLTLKEAMLVSACMFAVLHLSPLAFPHTFLIGILAVMMTYRTGSIWPGVLLHGMHNFLVLAEEVWWG